MPASAPTVLRHPVCAAIERKLARDNVSQTSQRLHDDSAMKRSGRQRMPQQIALQRIAAQFRQEVLLGGGFHAFGDDLQIRACGPARRWPRRWPRLRCSAPDCARSRDRSSVRWREGASGTAGSNSRCRSRRWRCARPCVAAACRIARLTSTSLHGGRFGDLQRQASAFQAMTPSVARTVSISAGWQNCTGERLTAMVQRGGPGHAIRAAGGTPRPGPTRRSARSGRSFRPGE